MIMSLLYLLLAVSCVSSARPGEGLFPRGFRPLPQQHQNLDKALPSDHFTASDLYPPTVMGNSKMEEDESDDFNREVDNLEREVMEKLISTDSQGRPKGLNEDDVMEMLEKLVHLERRSKRRFTGNGGKRFRPSGGQTRKRFTDLPELELAVNEGMLPNCEMQKSVLSRLRDLVMMALAQVKNCMAQREMDTRTKYSVSMSEGEMREPVAHNTHKGFDTRLLTI